jgi:hypothetical protein
MRDRLVNVRDKAGCNRRFCKIEKVSDSFASIVRHLRRTSLGPLKSMATPCLSFSSPANQGVHIVAE